MGTMSVLPTRPVVAGDVGSAVLPTDGIVLIGTPATIRSMACQLAEVRPVAIPSCCVVVPSADATSARERIAGAGARLDSLDDLANARIRITLALISLPTRYDGLLNQLTSQLDTQRVSWRVIPTIDRLMAASGESVLGGTGQSPSPPDGASPAQPMLRLQACRLTPGTSLDLNALIGRNPHQLDRERVREIVGGKRVLITGAGGSIGSVIAQLCCEMQPEQVLLMDRSENALFEIDRQIERAFPETSRGAVLHDVTDAPETKRIVRDLRPHVVFHAAAHKHVPLMEDHPTLAIRNNLLGTKSIADASGAAGVERFVMVSTDKAVHPRSVMGATKRLAEIYLTSAAERYDDTAFSIVRFGNVIGSACSVLTVWSSQLAEGSPITITDPRMTRFFMTIPEAATLVLQAATMGRPGQAPGIYVLDMGEPIPIVDLAVRFLEAHGLEPNFVSDPADRVVQTDRASADIVFTGVRPGEKLHEALAYAQEALRSTTHPGIRVVDALPGEPMDIDGMVADLAGVPSDTDPRRVIDAIGRYIADLPLDRPASEAA